MNFGIICACLPCLKAFVKHYFPNLPFFDPSLEQRVEASFRFSNRVAHFGPRSTDDDDDCVAGTSTMPTGSEKVEADSHVLRPKPSDWSESSYAEREVREESAAHSA